LILTFIEHQRGAIIDASLEALTAARKLAAGAGTSVEAILIGSNLRSLVDPLKGFGLAKVILAQDERLKSYVPEAFAKILAALIKERAPEIVIAPATEQGNDLMSRVAAKLDLGLATNCAELKTENGKLNLTRYIMGGSLLQSVELISSPKLLTIAPHAFAAEPAAKSEVELEIEELKLSLEEKDFRVQLKEFIESKKEGVSLAEAKVVIGGGRGVGSAEGFKILEELASLFGGAVGVTRVAVNNGWRPHDDQIGQTGQQIAPDLYIACGISGAIQHMVGCKGAKKIVAINKDKDAPIFSRADYGIVGDLHQVVPALIAEIKKLK